MGNEGNNGYECRSTQKINGRTVEWLVSGVRCIESEDVHAKLKPYNLDDPKDKRFFASVTNALIRKENFSFTNYEPKGRTAQALAAIATGLQPYPMMCREEAIKAGVYDPSEPEPRPVCGTEGIGTESP